MIILAIVIVLALLILIAGISVVQQSRAYVIERLGAFYQVWGTGIRHRPDDWRHPWRHHRLAVL